MTLREFIETLEECDIMEVCELLDITPRDILDAFEDRIREVYEADKEED